VQNLRTRASRWSGVALTGALLAGALAIPVGAQDLETTPPAVGRTDQLHALDGEAAHTTRLREEAAARSRGAGFGADLVTTTLEAVNRTIGAESLHQRGTTGEGVGVALIDSGVVPVAGLADTRVTLGPDLSLDAPVENLHYMDAYGHGTHMAGIIAGNGVGFRGVAPDATLLSVKVAPADGATDVSQVIAAIDWVVEHRNDNGMNIRVINLAFGTDGVQDHQVDPLAHAAETAWRQGIVVVVAAGNDGEDRGALRNPAYDPYVLAVGASDSRGTVGHGDDVVAAFSNRGDGVRNPDVLAPGRGIVSTRSPGSFLDHFYPDARIDAEGFRGSGTSQAAAVVSGAAALLLEERPELTPDQVKALLMGTAHRLSDADARAQGEGTIDLRRAVAQPAPLAVQSHPVSTGTGSLEAARGTRHVAMNGIELVGEYDIFGPWDSAAWAAASTAGTSWDGPLFMGAGWSGAGWSGAGWSGAGWSGAGWSGAGWSGAGWSGAAWSGAGWSGAGWSGAGWSGAGWSGAGWSGAGWSGAGWSGAGWSGAGWSGAGWSGAGWSGAGWSGAGWSGSDWSGVGWG
jgi:serine protease AprX